MNYSVVIDAGHGGTDSGVTGNNIIEKDYSLLISNYMKERFDSLGIPNIALRTTDRTLSDLERSNLIETIYGDDKNVIVISNHLNKSGESGLEIVYPLRTNDKLASLIAEQVELNDLTVNKYFQLRDPLDTSKDFYPIIRDTPNYNTVLLNYGYVDNINDAQKLKNNYKDYAEAVVRAVTLYIGANYVPIGTNYYIVKKGDSLYKIAGTYGVTVDSIKDANKLTTNILNIGQILKIPENNYDVSDDTYIVKKGDSLYKIAGVYGVTVDAIKEANNLKTNNLSIGQSLIIPSKNSEDMSNTYIVKKGDTLYKIASNYGISVDGLKKINNLMTDSLSIGQILKIPNNLSGKTYIVKKGDSLYKIAGIYGTTIDAIKEANNLKTNDLSIGQILSIPY